MQTATDLSFEHVRWIVLVALMIGVALLLNTTISTVGEGIALRVNLRRRRRRFGLLAGLLPADVRQIAGREAHKFWLLAPIALGGVMALLAWDLLISTFFLVLGFGISYVVEARGRLTKMRRLTHQAEVLIVKFRSTYSVENSIFITLELVAREMPAGEVRRAVERCVELNNSGRLSVEEKFAPLLALDSPHLRRIASVLARAESASTETFGEVLLDLETDITRQMQVEREAGIEMAAVKGTARALQGAGLLAAVWAVIVPAWRAYFTATLQQRMLFVFLAATVAIGSVYLEREIFSIEKGEVE